jgi:hypothetical protein
LQLKVYLFLPFKEFSILAVVAILDGGWAFIHNFESGPTKELEDRILKDFASIVFLEPSWLYW